MRYGNRDQIRSTVCNYLYGSPRGRFSRNTYKKPWLWWRYIDDIFMIWQHGEDELKIFLKKLNNFHPSIKFTCEYSREKVNFLDVQVIVREGNVQQMFSKLTVINTSTLHHVIHTTVLNRYLIVKH